MRILERPKRFCHSLRHTRPTQIYHRLRLIVLRRYRERVGPPTRFIDDGPELRADLPSSPFEPRRHLVVRGGGDVHLDIAGFLVPWASRTQWHPTDNPPWTHLRRFHLHYTEWLEGLTDEECAATLRSWVDSNRPYERGYWEDAWSSYVVSLRTVVWLQQLASRSALDSETRALAGRSVVEQIRVLAAHIELDVQGNHLMKNAKALSWAGASFCGIEAERWSGIGTRLLDEVLEDQVLDDGMHYERSPAYHAQVFVDLLECHRVLEPGAMRSRVREALG